MQKDSKWLYNKAAEEEGIPLELVKSIGDAVFSKIRERMENPENLIIKVKDFGHFYLRSNRYRERLEGLKNSLKNGVHIPGPEVHAEIERLTPRIQKLDDLYEQYKAKRLAIREAKDNFNPTD